MIFNHLYHYDLDNRNIFFIIQIDFVIMIFAQNEMKPKFNLKLTKYLCVCVSAAFQSNISWLSNIQSINMIRSEIQYEKKKKFPINQSI